MLDHFISSILNLIYPNICVGCASEAIAQPSILCLDCASQLPYTHMKHHERNAFEQHFAGRVHIEAGTALFYFTKGGIIQEAIHAMKYKNQPQIGVSLGRMLGKHIQSDPKLISCDAVIGVPLHKKKKWERGYNQADAIAKGVAEVLQIPCYTDAIIRNRSTTSQTRKSRLMRMQNMRQGFVIAKPQDIEGKHILLVDDVLTSGATLDFCGQAVLKQRNTRLSMATIAMGSIV